MISAHWTAVQRLANSHSVRSMNASEDLSHTCQLGSLAPRLFPLKPPLACPFSPSFSIWLQVRCVRQCKLLARLYAVYCSTRSHNVLRCSGLAGCACGRPRPRYSVSSGLNNSRADLPQQEAIDRRLHAACYSHFMHSLVMHNRFQTLRYDTIRYDGVYLACSKKLTCSQLSLPQETNRQIVKETTN